jgi:predicted nuclease with TOPRIM domain
MEHLGVLIPILALSIPVVAVVMNGLQKMMRLRLEEARTRAGLVDGSAGNELSALRDEVEQMRQELDEVHERLDFTERALTQGREHRRQLDDGQSG